MTADYRISNGVSSLVSGTGTITIPVGTTSIVGSGTNFTGQLHAGDLIIAAGHVIGSVISVTDIDDAVLTYAYPGTDVTAAAYQIDPLVRITSINSDAIDPLGDYHRWAATLPLVNSLERAAGRPLASWLWKNIGVNLRTGLLVYCPSKSARVYIRTLIDPNLDTFATMQAAMLWPDTDVSYQSDFVVSFRDLILL